MSALLPDFFVLPWKTRNNALMQPLNPLERASKYTTREARFTALARQCSNKTAWAYSWFPFTIHHGKTRSPFHHPPREDTESLSPLLSLSALKTSRFLFLFFSCRQLPVFYLRLAATASAHACLFAQLDASIRIGPRWDLQGFLKALDRLTDFHVALQKALEQLEADWKAAREERERAAADEGAGSALDDTASSATDDDCDGSEAPSSVVDSEDLDRLWDNFTISTGGTAASQEGGGPSVFGLARGNGGGGGGRGGKKQAGSKEEERVEDNKQMGPEGREMRWRELVSECGRLRRHGVWILLEEMEEALKKDR